MSLTTPLIIASENGHIECVKQLLGANAHFNYKNFFKTMPLIIASMNGRVKCVEKLLEAKANIDIKDYEGATVMDYASNEEEKNLLKTHKKQQIVEEMIKVLPFPVVGGHIVLFEWIVEYVI